MRVHQLNQYKTLPALTPAWATGKINPYVSQFNGFPGSFP